MKGKSLFIRCFFLLNIFLLCLLGSSTLFAQQFQHLKCEGEIPLEFITPSSKKVLADVEKNQGLGEKEKILENFALASNFAIDDLLTSGKVLFNDPVSQYCGKILDEILKKDPALRAQVRVYTIKSPEVNAFATDNGIIFVTLGLIAQLQDEAQLAFILCHEIQHFSHNHSMNEYVVSEKLKQGQGIYNKISLGEALLLRSNYSKQQELEADQEGFLLFRDSGYNPEAVNGVLDVLLYAQLPYDEVKWDQEFFNTSSLQIPEDYFLGEITQVNTDEDANDTLSTHPNIRKRREALKPLVEISGKKGKSNFLVSKETFLDLRTRSRFELNELYLKSRQNEKALYNAWLMLQKFPNEEEVEETIVRSLYSIAVSRLEGDFWNHHISYDKIEGESQQLYYLFEELEYPEMVGLALVQAWKFHQKYPNNASGKMLALDLMERFHQKYPKVFEGLSKEPKVVVEVIEEETEPDSLSGKYAKLKKQREEELGKGRDDEESFIKYAFVDLFKEGSFVTAYQKECTEEKEFVYPQTYAAQLDEYKQKRKKGYQLGVDKIVMVSPFIEILDYRSPIPEKYLESERRSIEFREMVKENADMNNLESEILTVENLAAGETEKFNDMALLNSWVAESMGASDIPGYILTQNESGKYLADKYGTPYFVWTGTFSIKKTRPNKFMWCYYGCFTGIMLPYAIAKIVTPEKHTFYYSLVFNVETNELLMADITDLRADPAKDYLHSTIYYSMSQIKSKAK